MNYITENERIYAKDASGKIIAEITFPTENGIATINHTFVDSSLRGKGIANQLVQMAVNKILADGNKIAATCLYAIVWFQRHAEYQVYNTVAPIACRIDRKKS
ncbi:N-acetyltransferase [Prevotella cerevisiae]|uniref:N-acetyltransferase n=1 Tax=Segatella cerevisiae TaxID=2053716 RepID=A0ABT1BY36_9BACT|nr:GNAT family N-acetyltransferase [Segatella cerevisiae]MCO6025981.1 N-acetyltransferase [Segatella cerevisiae]